MATKVRNPVARTSILGKGGVHVKSRSGERHKLKQQTRREVRQWSKEKGASRPPSCFQRPIRSGVALDIVAMNITEAA